MAAGGDRSNSMPNIWHIALTSFVPSLDVGDPVSNIGFIYLYGLLSRIGRTFVKERLCVMLLLFGQITIFVLVFRFIFVAGSGQ